MSNPWVYILVPIFLYSPSQAQQRDASAGAVNGNFFEGIPPTSNTDILVVMVDTHTLAHGDADAKLLQYPKPKAEPLAETCGLMAAPTAPFTLNCGVKMLGQEASGVEMAYYFLLKARQGDWYQIILSPQSGATTWVKDPHEAGLGMFAHHLRDWLQSQDSYQTAHDIAEDVQPIPVRAQPNDTAEDLTDCVSYSDGDGLIPATDKDIKGDWIHVTCLENNCYAANNPQKDCDTVLNTQDTPCLQGWARWRSRDGHLELYPHDALAQDPCGPN